MPPARTPLRARVDPMRPLWFNRFPRVMFAVVVALFIGVFALRMLAPGPDDAVIVLFVFPIALLALARGLLPGIVAGALTAILLVLWAVYREVDLSLVGWASRVLPLLLVGGLLGDASDRLRRGEALRHAHALAAQRHRQAVDINDSLVQGMASAKWRLEAGDVASGLATLDDTIDRGQQLISELIRSSGMGLGENERASR